MGCSVGFKYAKKCIGGRGSTRTPLGELTTPPDLSVRKGDTSPNAPPRRRLQRLDSRALGASILVSPPGSLMPPLI